MQLLAVRRWPVGHPTGKQEEEGRKEQRCKLEKGFARQ